MSDRSLISQYGAGALAILFVVAALAINTFPIITNDSLQYIDYSRDFGGRGLVWLGYRQFGYPMVLALERLVSPLVGVEPLLLAALAQRLVLAFGVFYAVWLWGWRSVPVILVAVTPSFIIYTNFILTEGLTVPLGLILACVLGHHFRILYKPALLQGNEISEARAFYLMVAACLLALLMMAMRYPLAVFVVVPAAMLAAAISRASSNRLRYIVAFSIFAGLAAFLSLGLAVENDREYGVFNPTIRGERTEYWGAWRLTFALHPENQDELDLSLFFDGGSPHGRINEIEGRYPDYQAQATELEESIVALLHAAALDRNRERAFSFLGGLRGGRIDDLSTYLQEAVRSTARTVDAAMFRNTYAIENGPEAFATTYNDGEIPEAMITSPVFPMFPGAGLQRLLSVLLPATAAGIVVIAALKKRLILGVVYVVPLFVSAAALGWLLLDNIRFLLPAAIFLVAGLSAVWSASPRIQPQQRAAVPTSGGSVGRS